MRLEWLPKHSKFPTADYPIQASTSPNLCETDAPKPSESPKSETWDLHDYASLSHLMQYYFLVCSSSLVLAIEALNGNEKSVN